MYSPLRGRADVFLPEGSGITQRLAKTREPERSSLLTLVRFYSLCESGVGEGVSPALTFQDGQVTAHAGHVDDSTGAAPVFSHRMIERNKYRENAHDET